MDISEDVLAKTIFLRHTLHRQPELAMYELGTSKNIVDFIRGLSGLEPLATDIGGCGILYQLNESEGKECILFVSHLDGAPIPEDANDLEWVSEKPFVSHANGNDGHSASLAAFCVLVASNNIHLNRSTYVLFQSGGQTGPGSWRALEDLVNYIPSDRLMYSFMIVNVPGRSLGTASCVRSDVPATLCSIGLAVTFSGKPAHAATQSLGANPIVSLAQLAQDINKSFSDFGKAGIQATLVSLHADTHFGNNPASVYSSAAAVGKLNITLRGGDRKRLADAQQWIEKRARELIADQDVTVYFEDSEEFEAIFNDFTGIKAVMEASKAVDIPFTCNTATMRWSNDFWRFGGGTLVCMGAGDVEPLHDSCYDFPDELLKPMIKLLLALGSTGIRPTCSLPSFSSPGIVTHELTHSPTTFLLDRMEPIEEPPTSNCVIEINRQCLKTNAELLIDCVGENVKVVAVVKANAYGLGYSAVVPVLESVGITDFAVANATEAARCIQAITGADSTVQIMTPISDTFSASWVVSNRKRVQPWIGTQTAWSLLHTELEHVTDEFPLNVHVEVETGLNRTGIRGSDTIIKLCREIVACPTTKLIGICTHLAGAEKEANMTRVRKQLVVFNKMVDDLKESSIIVPYVHCASSAAAILEPSARFSMVRCGVALVCGTWPTHDTFLRYQLLRANSPDVYGPLSLESVLTWRSQIIHVFMADDGEWIGYGDSKQLSGNTKVAVVPVGYSDGFTTQLSNVGYFLIHGRRCYILGHVNMSMVMVNVTHLQNPEVEVGDDVIIIGRQGDDEIQVASFEEHSFVNYELLTRLSRDIPRIVVGFNDIIQD